MKYNWILWLTILLPFVACKKENEQSEVPSIALESISKTEVVQFKDSIIILLTFIDGDGDLGRQHPDDNSLYIKDERLTNAERYHLPPLLDESKDGETSQGSIRVFVPSLFLLGNGGDEVTRLSIKVQDQAGNWSDEVVTPTITITQ